MSRIIDISVPIHDKLAMYPGDPAPRLEVLHAEWNDGPSRITRVHELTTHTGTHLDAPIHFIEGGKALDEIELTRFRCAARVITTGPIVTEADVPDDIDAEAVLFRAGAAGYMTPAAAHKCAASNANMVGIDSFSIDPIADEFPAHRVVLGQNILVLEHLNLTDAVDGRYELWAMPLRITGADGSPTRAVLVSAGANQY